MLRLIRNDVSLVIGGVIDPEQEGYTPVGPDTEMCDSDDTVGIRGVRHATGPFPVSPVPALAGEVTHRYRI